MVIRQDIELSLKILEYSRARMPDFNDEFPAGTIAKVSGWGETNDGLQSNVLMAVDVQIDSNNGLLCCIL